MSTDFKTVDQSNFKCIRFENGSIYYGQVEYLNTQNNTISFNYEELDQEAKAQHKRVRHGYGIELFGKTSENLMCKYVGKWECNEMSGHGEAYLPDGSQYRGEFKHSLFQGHGRFKWANGDSYQGSWRKGCLDGAGKYTNSQDGNVFEGIFKKNYYNHENKSFIDPSLTQSEAMQFLNKAYENQAKRAKQADAYQNRVRFFRCQNTSQFQKALKQTDQAGRVPFIVSDSCSKNTVLGLIKKAGSCANVDQQGGQQFDQVHELDMRQLYNQIISGPMREQHSIISKKQAGTTTSSNFKRLSSKTKLQKMKTLQKLHSKAYGNTQQIKENALQKLYEQITSSLTSGNALVINLDDSDAIYEELFDPDIREFYGIKQVPQHIWRKEQMLKREVWDAYNGRGSFETQISSIVHAEDQDQDHKDEFNEEQVSQKYMIFVWSKYRFDRDLSETQYIDRFEKRYGKSIPMDRVNMVFLSPPQKDEGANETGQVNQQQEME